MLLQGKVDRIVIELIVDPIRQPYRLEKGAVFSVGKSLIEVIDLKIEELIDTEKRELEMMNKYVDLYKDIPLFHLLPKVV